MVHLGPSGRCCYRAAVRSGTVGPGVVAGSPSGRSDRRQRAAEWLQPESRTPSTCRQQRGCDLLHEERRTCSHKHTNTNKHCKYTTTLAAEVRGRAPVCYTGWLHLVDDDHLLGAEHGGGQSHAQTGAGRLGNLNEQRP